MIEAQREEHASSSGSVGSVGLAYDDQTHAGGVDAGFFERERSRLIQDVSKGVESILGNSNALNRKIEESISVGKEFHPISELWSKFESVMVASGIGNLHPQSGTGGIEGALNTVQGGENVTPSKPSQPPAREEGDQEAPRFDLGTTTSTGLPPGVAPGGGRIYA